MEHPWVAAFKQRLGRAPRVLHIGNIANNAFNNAKLMRAAGVDCDVLCYDYYHVMGTPEWEEADFDESPADQFAPDWSRVDLRGYERPDWFAQGPDTLCLEYLAAKRGGEAARARLLWDALSLANRTRRLDTLRRGWLEKLCLLALVARARIERRYRVVTTHPEPRRRVQVRLAPLRARIGGAAAVIEEIAFIVVMLLRGADAAWRSLRGARGAFRRKAGTLVERFGAEFPRREDQLTLDELWRYERLLPRWEELFAHYDIVQAYATDPVLPLMAGRGYFAFEHGTLREIPFEQTPEGRTTALAYRLATHVFVTNQDCLAPARLLAGERVTFINHPYDENQAQAEDGAARLREELRRALDAEFLFFFPTRQDWADGKKTAEKANDVLLRAFAELRSGGLRVGMVACEWGLDLRASKRLLEELGCSRFVRWLPPMGIVRFNRFARACDVVADQFRIGALGGVGFKALAAGAPLLGYLDEAALRAVYAEPPPAINCRSTAEIVVAVRGLIADPARLKQLADASRRWIAKYHSAAATVESQLAAYANAREQPAPHA